MKALALMLLLGASPVPALEAATAGWSEAQRAQASLALERLTSAGVEKIAALDRLAEWQAKGADAPRAVALLEAFASAAQEGRDAAAKAGLAPRSMLVEAAASARQSGVSADQLVRVLHGSTTSDEGHGRCLALTTLVTSGFAPAGAAEVVQLAAEQGYRGPELGSLVTSAQRLMREGAAPRPTLLTELGSAVRRGVPPGGLYPAVVRSLSGAPRPGPEAGFNHPVLRNQH